MELNREKLDGILAPRKAFIPKGSQSRSRENLFWVSLCGVLLYEHII
jgi:hypothetical protein